MHFTKTYIQDLSQHMNTACANSPLICPYAGLTSRSRTQASSSDRACVAKRITIIQQLDMGVLSSLERPQASNFGFTTNERGMNTAATLLVKNQTEHSRTLVCKYELHNNIHPGSESTHAYCMFRLHQIERVLPIASQAFSNWTWGFSPPWNARKLPTLDSQQMSAT